MMQVQVSDTKPNELITFGQDLAQIVESIRLLKKTYPNHWQEACQKALDDGELTLSDALSGLVTAQMLVEES
ncbi:hypothetical protein LC593_23470 [Nostoc sp. CHAB 5844]|nr:hypothetical protein [Nostoc sp. CHAB 5844]